jgi:prepilin-type N-terminal cleavage/methylation domain-containing protein
VIGAARRAHATRAEGGDGGFTLVEMLVAISVFAVLTVAVFSGLTKTAQTVNDVRSIANLTEEARVATERMSRELRQASKILDAHLPVNAADYTSITFWVDFNGNHLEDLNAADPEVVTYRFEPGSGQLTLTANDSSGTAVTRPILAARVTGFVLTFSSSLWEYDTNPRDGVTDWKEINASAIGNHNLTFDDGEFKWIDSVGLTIQLLDGPRMQTYTTQVDLRNQNQN